MSFDKVVEFLTELRLQTFADKFGDLGVTILADLKYVQEEDLDAMGMKKIHKNKFLQNISKITDFVVEKPSVPVVPSAPPIIPVIVPSAPVLSSPIPNAPVPVPISAPVPSAPPPSGATPIAEAISIVSGSNFLNYHIYRSLQPERRDITGLDFEHTTYGQLKQLISDQEKLGTSVTVELFAPEGYPLAPDTHNYDKSLKEWHFSDGDLILAIPCRASMVKIQTLPELHPDTGDTQIFVKYNRTYVINVDMATDTGNTVRQKLYSKLQIPTPSIKLSYAGKPIKPDNTLLQDYGVCKNSTLHMWFYGVTWVNSWAQNFSSRLCLPLIDQSEEGLSLFNSVLYVVSMHFVSETTARINKVLGHIRRITKCPPLVCALDRLFRKRTLSFPQKVAIQESLYQLFRALLPQDTDKPITNLHVFEKSSECWAFLMTESLDSDRYSEEYAQTDLTCCITKQRLKVPICLPGSQLIYEREQIEECIKNKDTIPGVDVNTITLGQITESKKCLRLLMSVTEETEAMVWSKGGKSLYELPNIHKPQFNCTPVELKDKMKQISCLEVIPPLKIKSISSTYRLTTNSEGNVIVYLERNPCGTPGSDWIFYDPAQGNECDKNPDELANKAGTSSTGTSSLPSSGYTPAAEPIVIVAAPPEVITRPPEEAIIVLLDVSWSMDEEYEHGMTRLQAVKQLFHAFANRSMAYNLHNVIGLTLFATDIKVHSRVTELFERFKQKVDIVMAEGRTKLYDAIIEGIRQLTEFMEKYKECRKRIICLTDGEDCLSKKTPLHTARLALENQVIVDSILIGSGNRKMKAISMASGGCCFLPPSLTEALKLFEMEEVLTLANRQIKPLCQLDLLTESLLRRIENPTLYKYNEKPPRLIPQELDAPVVSVRTKLQRAANGPVLTPGGGGEERRVRRILKELSIMQREKHPNLELYPNENDVGFWRMLLTGPEFTPYQSAVFLLYVRFPLNYPEGPPEIRFITPIYHCNINSSGRICHSVFGRNYTSDMEFRALMDCVFGLLCEPEPGDPLDSNMAEEYFSRRQEYNQMAENWCVHHCKKQLEVWRAEFVSEEEAAHSIIPASIVCPLCAEIFLDPVQTPYGNTYERQAIEDHIDAEGNDPLAYKPLTKDQLSPNLDKKREVSQYNQECNITGWWDAAH
ncbi:hypothetical protein LOD99_14356 [Oopsacas minuta]|uniref:non-specific protein-tyrosine kinase n=1 Tax=Oopsacas minuta TaxID=111878 RepID=A0AAV7KGJ5_9METZ|nr:hypothetical protein LOD99_14356 [Oopsacas minuta]